jgi:K319-like protein
VPLPAVGGQVPPTETDSLCPQMNRPLDPDAPTMPLGNFTLCNRGAFALGQCLANVPPAPPVGILNNAKATVVANSDATAQAPFQVGDYIEYSGTIQQDDSLGTATGVPAAKYVSAWNIVGNVGIYTSPGAAPAYLAIELTILGTGGTAITAPLPVPEEVTTRIKARGFFTDPARLVDVFAVVVDPCTGVETETLMLGSIPNQKGGVPWGRFRDIDQFGVFPITRQWRVRYTPIATDPGYPGLPTGKVANGLAEMTYTIPVSTFITPENLVYGDPTLLVVPQNFQDWQFLTQGEGPWRGNPQTIVGQLTPFPLTNSIPGLTPGVPGTASCPASLDPVVKISPATQTVAQNTNVTLDASHSTDPSGLPLSFLWVQKSGLPTVTLNNANTSKADFKAPNVSANTSYTFQVTVTDSASRSSTGSTLIVVTPQKVFTDTVTIAPGGIVYRVNRGVLNATATSSDSTCSAILTLTAPGTNLPAGGVLMTPQGIPGPGVPCTYNWTSGKQVAPAPTSVTVTSSLGGSATATVANGELVIK